MLTVACVWVQGNVPYTTDYVYKLRRMVQRHMRPPWRFVCLTDRPLLLPGIETRRIPSPNGWPGWWSKLELFNPEHFPAGTAVLYLDLDVLVVDALWPISLAGVGSALALIPPDGSFMGAPGKRVVRRYNSSVMTFVAGVHTDLFTAWTPEVTYAFWGDQDWIGERLPNQLTFPLEWFPRISSVGADEAKAAGARVILCKHPKNHVAAVMWPWVARVWQ